MASSAAYLSRLEIDHEEGSRFMPERMMRSRSPKLSRSYTRLPEFGTSSTARTVPTRISGFSSTSAVMLGLMGAGFIVRYPLGGPRLFADEGVEIGDAARAGGTLGIVFDLLPALRLDAL